MTASGSHETQSFPWIPSVSEGRAGNTPKMNIASMENVAGRLTCLRCVDGVVGVHPTADGWADTRCDHCDGTGFVAVSECAGCDRPVDADEAVVVGSYAFCRAEACAEAARIESGSVPNEESAAGLQATRAAEPSGGSPARSDGALALCAEGC